MNLGDRRSQNCEKETQRAKSSKTQKRKKGCEEEVKRKENGRGKIGVNLKELELK